jgi:hypothetical protein
MASLACSLDYLGRSSSCSSSRQNRLQLKQQTRKATTLSHKVHSDKVNKTSSLQLVAKEEQQAQLLVNSSLIRAKALKSKHRRTICRECSMVIISSKERTINLRQRTRNRSNTTTSTWRARLCHDHHKATRQIVAALFRQVKVIRSQLMGPQAQLRAKTISLDR